MRLWALILSLIVILGASPSSAATKPITGSNGAPMVHVPAGWFIRGSVSGDSDEKPRRRVYLDGFYIDKYEVTNALFRASGMRPKKDYGSRPTFSQ